MELLLQELTSVSGGDTSTVYFTAGLTNEAHGLFAGISNSTTAGSTPNFGLSASPGAATVTAGSSVQATVSVAPVNGFSGTVTLACSGLPSGATCNFSPSQINVAATASAIGTVTIQTAKASASLRPREHGHTDAEGITCALLLPFASMLAFRRRQPRGSSASRLRLLSVMFVFMAAAGLILGCADNSAFTAGTPVGQSAVIITASSGAVSQQTSVSLIVQ